ncbi:MAG: AAA family ATPase [Actinomycetia bacterium]|nr:AAA family ATPase [Actinomycetes bacterium]
MAHLKRHLWSLIIRPHNRQNWLFLMSRLVDWKNSNHKKPIIINGARQVGKTWLLKEFGSRCFDNVAYVNFDNNAAMSMLFDEGYECSHEHAVR